MNGPYGSAENIAQEGGELWHVVMADGRQYISRFGDHVLHYVTTSERAGCIHSLEEWVEAGVDRLADGLNPAY